MFLSEGEREANTRCRVAMVNCHWFSSRSETRGFTEACNGTLPHSCMNRFFPAWTLVNDIQLKLVDVLMDMNTRIIKIWMWEWHEAVHSCFFLSHFYTSRIIFGKGKEFNNLIVEKLLPSCTRALYAAVKIKYSRCAKFYSPPIAPARSNSVAVLSKTL